MNEKTFMTLINLLALCVISFNVLAGSSHLDEVIKHTEQAISAPGGISLAQHAAEAKQHAKAVKEDEADPTKHINQGIRRLEDAIGEGNNGNYDVARQEAIKALEHFRAAK